MFKLRKEFIMIQKRKVYKLATNAIRVGSMYRILYTKFSDLWTTRFVLDLCTD